jgi:nephrocystin-3
MSTSHQSSSSRTVRVFLSSTFRDFAEERDLLVRKIFPELRRKCRERQVELVDVDLRWGITEEEAKQGKVLPICLAEIDRSRPYFMGFIGERYGWTPEFDQYDLSLLMEQPWLEEHRGGKSVTELEMLHGVLNNPQMKDRAFFYFRNSEYSQSKGGAYLSEGPADKAKLEQLKDRIRTSGFPVEEGYQDPEALGDMVLRDLWKVIDEAYPVEEIPDPLTLERRKHEAYAGSRLGLYLVGKQYFQALDAAMGAEPFNPVLITGASGGGKSALIANWSKAYSENHPETLEIVHYLGSGADAADPVKLVTRLLQEIARITGEELKLESHPQKILNALPEWLARASSYAESEGREWLILLDGLDKLSSLRDLRWWPGFLPPLVKLVVSCLDGEVLEQARKRMEWCEINVLPLSSSEGVEILREYLRTFNKCLPNPEYDRIAKHPLSTSPLFVRILAEEMRVFGQHEQLHKKLESYLSATTIDGLFAKVLERIEGDNTVEDVRASLSSIWSSRAGLAQNELVGEHSITGLVPATWAPIHNALNDSILESGGRLQFGHDYVRKAVEERYLPTAEAKNQSHVRIAEWFASHPVNARVAEELPWQWEKADEKKRLKACLLDPEIFGLIYDRNEYELLAYWLHLKVENQEEIYSNAWEHWEKALQIKALAESTDRLCRYLIGMGWKGLKTQNLSVKAVELLAQTYGDASPETLRAKNALALLIRDNGRPVDALKIYDEIIPEYRRALGPDDPMTLAIIGNRAGTLYKSGDLDAAESAYRELLEIWRGAANPDPAREFVVCANLGLVLVNKGNTKEAARILRDAHERAKQMYGENNLRTLVVLSSLADVVSSERNNKECESLREKVYEGRKNLLGNNHPDTCRAAYNLGKSLLENGHPREAEKLYRLALNGLVSLIGKTHPDLIRVIVSLAMLLNAELGKSDEAVSLLNGFNTLDHEDLDLIRINFAEHEISEKRTDTAMKLIQPIILHHPERKSELESKPSLSPLREFIKAF